MAKTAYAKDTWIQVVGIDEQNPAQNYTDFYMESELFSKACHLKANRDCIKFINSDSSLAKDQEEMSKLNLNTLDNVGAPSDQSKNLYLTISNALKNAKPGDQILIAMQNHGAPALNNDNGSTSCLYYSNTAKLCDQDIKNLVDLAPSGVKVAFLADGCYSGGFANISSKKLCVLTTADQHSVGFSGTAKFWTNIINGQVKILSDFDKIHAMGGSSVRPASRIMEDNRCRIFSDSITSSFGDKEYELIEKLKDYVEINVCSLESYDSLNTIRHLKDLVLYMIGESEKKDVADFTQKLCDPKNSIFTQKLCNNWKMFLQLPRRELELISMAKSKKAYEKAESKLQQEFNRELQPRKLNEFVDKLYLHEGNPANFSKPDLSQLSSSELKMVTKAVKSQQAAYKHLGEARSTFAKEVEMIKAKMRKENPSVQSIVDCIGKLPTLGGFWETIAQEKPRGFMSDEIIEEAKKCEESFSL